MSTARTSGNHGVSNGTGTGRGLRAVGAGAATLARRTALGLWMGLLASANSPVAAAEFQTHLADDLNIVVVTGEIEPGDDDRFLTEVERATTDGAHAMVVLSSDGGALGAGMHMGLVIREAGLPTFVPEGERCASACALAWLAGEPRMTTAASEIGFHQPYDESNGTMVASIEANAVVGHYIATIGMGPEIVSFAVSAPPESMAWLTPTIATGLGLDVLEIAADAVPSGGEAMAMASGRTPPVDESVRPVAAVPLPVMRDLTVAETASVSVTGLADGAGPIGERGLPLVTAYGADAGVPADAMGGPFEPLLADAHGASWADEDWADEVWAHDDLMGAEMSPALALPADRSVSNPDGTSVANVETAVLDALHSYGLGGAVTLQDNSAACWRHVRAEPDPRGLQYCHVFDLVAAEVVDPADPGDFADFAIGIRLRAHRELVAADMPVGFADAWRGEAGMVVASMDAH